jgi:hypothetical protein
MFDAAFDIVEHYEEFKYYRGRDPLSFGILETREGCKRRKGNRETIHRRDIT